MDVNIFVYNKIIKALYEAKTNSSINESYATIKDRFIRDGADKSEVKTLLDLHKKLKDMKRLKSDEINIDSFVKGKSFDEFKSLMSRYTEKDTATKTDKFNELKNKIVAQNSEWIVYKIDTADEAYLFHGLTKWCIVSGSKTDAEEYFDKYVFKQRSNFYFIVRKDPIGDEWDYIALQLQEDNKIYWDKNDKEYKTLPKSLDIPELSLTYKQLVPNSWKLNNDGSYDVDDNIDLSKFKQFIEDGKLIIKFSKVTGNFYCFNCDLNTLEGCPEYVGGNFDCSYNELTSLEGAPKEVGGTFDCSINILKTLDGSPKTIKGSFFCTENRLTSLEGGPKEVNGNFDCSYNKLTSLEGCPEKVGKNFDCSNNSEEFTKEEVEQHCKVKGDIHV